MIFCRLFIFLLALIMVSPLQAKVFKIATISPDGLSWMKQLRASAKEIEKLTEGRVKFKIYPGGVQGDDQTVLRKMRIGQLHGGAVAAGSLTKFYPDLQIYNLPLEFRDYREVDYVRQRIDSRIVQGLEDNGLISFGLTETGFAYILSNSPITSIAELRSVKAWVPNNDPVALGLVKSFGVTPIPLGLADVLASLQTGLINAVAVPPIVAIALQWHTQLKYITEMPLVYIYSLMAMDKKTFYKMAPDDQGIVKRILNKTFADINRNNRLDNVTAYQALLDQGLKAVTPGAESMNEWLATAKTSIDNLIDEGRITRESMDALMIQLDAVRGIGTP
jgi:TRAP-type C4-dicarboxylate transport system substrate-binding protein